ncbi:neurotrimin-like [Actinia tenebrosa]|uniref:Neurotrimin-like n=1 Tax=Actinia tenebrosa TaxID=6105 RepID=A0A6P8IYY9_ACTTE|nr:neurotrimin-like [Actinia tenebrosa]
MEWWLRSNWLNISLHLIELTLFMSYVDAAVQFTVVAPKVFYIPVNGTAKFNWDYTVTDRVNELKDHSPTWDLYLPNGSSTQLAYENTNNRSWRLSDSCPLNLRARIKIELPATLVISQVTLEDTGIYGCSLVLNTGAPLTNTSHLIVFDPPTFINAPSGTIEVLEGGALDVKCLANGNPVPIVKWYGPKGRSKIISSGRGSASLKIQNIRRYSNGTYECQANNYLQQPITKQVSVIIYYRPAVDVAPSTLLNAPSWNNHLVILHCLAFGNPSPVISWKNPNGYNIQYGVSSTKDGSLLTLITREDDDYGEYKCRATNSLGYAELIYKVYKIAVPGPPVIREITSKPFSIYIKWRRAPNNGGSPIIDYKISINTNPIKEVSIKDTFIVIGALEGNTIYSINISARNLVGYGNVTSIIEKTQKGSSVPSAKSTIALAVCLPIIFILLLVIVALLIYLWRKKRRSKGVNHQDGGILKLDTNLATEDERNSEERGKYNGHIGAEAGHKSGSCFQPFVKRPKRRPGQPRSKPLHILEPIKEEIIEEKAPDQEHEERIKVDKKISENGRTSGPVEYEEITIEPGNSDVEPKFGEFSLA